MPHTTPRPAFAKVNLGLEVLRKRPDNYHDIETVFYRIQLADELEVRGSSHGITMECDDPRLSVGEDNLCIRAALALRRRAGIDLGAHIVLRKRIPTGAGLGGGSSDAATVLTALNEIWNPQLAVPDLREVAATIGSDVTGFLAGPLTFASGRGELGAACRRGRVALYLVIRKHRRKSRNYKFASVPTRLFYAAAREIQ